MSLSAIREAFTELKNDLKSMLYEEKKVTLNFFKKQVDVLNCTSPKIILSGGYGSGKTIVGLYKFLVELKKRGGVGIATGFSFNTLKKLIEQTLVVLNIDYTLNFSQSMVCTGFGDFYLYGMDTVRSKQRIRSLNLSCWYADEVTLQDELACKEVMARLRSVTNPFWLWSTNPDSPSHWVYPYLSKIETMHFSFKTSDNPTLPKGYIDNLHLTKNSNDYRRLVMGDWVPPDENPFKNMFYSEHEIQGEIYCVIDPSLEGVDYTAVSLGCFVGGEIVVLGQIFKKDYIEVIDDPLFSILLRKSTYIYYEKNIAGNILADQLYQKLDIYAEPFRTFLNKDKKIRAITGLVNMGKIKFDEACSDAYLTQIMTYSKNAKHDDAPDSLAMLINKMGEFGYV